MINKENNFNIIRWMALAMVILGHTYVLLGLTPPVLMGMQVHGIGVRILFIISGYLVCQSFKKDTNIKKFFIKRFFRIFPLLIFVILATVILCSAFTTFILKDYFYHSFSYIYHNILLSPKFDLPGVFEKNYYPIAVNGSLWTLPIEFVCYFSIPCFYKLFNNKFGKKIFLFIMVFGLIMASLLELGIINKSFVFWGTDWGRAWSIASFFVAGMAINLLNIEKYLSTQISILLIFIFGILSPRISVSMLVIILPYIILSFALTDKPLFSGFMNKLECSYGMYLWGFIIQQSLINILCIRMNLIIQPEIMFLLCLTVTFAFSIITSLLIEKPVNKLVLKYLA